MPELMSSPIFLVIAAIVAIFLLIGIIKHVGKFFIWIVIIVAVLIWLGITNVPEVRNWFENLLKMVER